MDDTERAVTEIEAIDINSLRVIPDGADKPLPLATIDDATLTPADIRRAIRRWNKIMPRFWRGALEAKLATPKNTRSS